MNQFFKFYDENKTGFITFLSLRKILENINLKMKNDLVEYFIYIMKSFNDKKASIYDLKYDNIFKILTKGDGTTDQDSNPENLEENEDDDEEEEIEEQEEENEEDEEVADQRPGASQYENNMFSSSIKKNENDEEAIEITPEEYLAKVTNVIRKICVGLNLTNTKLDHHFIKFINNNNDTQFRAIELGKLIQILNEEFNIILSPVDIYCIYTKLKPGKNENENEEGSDEHINDEFVDYDKLANEVQDFLSTNKEENDIKNSIDVNSKHINGITKISHKAPVQLIELSNPENNHFNNIRPREDFIQSIKQYLKQHNISFERFIFLQHLNMHLLPVLEKHNQTNSKSYNRFIDIKEFEKFLISKNIITTLINPVEKNKLQVTKTNIDKNILFCDTNINIDYLKSILSNDNKEKSNHSSDKQFTTVNGTAQFYNEK